MRLGLGSGLGLGLGFVLGERARACHEPLDDGAKVAARRQRVNPTSSLFSSDDTLKEDEAEYLEVNIT